MREADFKAGSRYVSVFHFIVFLKKVSTFSSTLYLFILHSSVLLPINQEYDEFLNTANSTH